MKNKELLQIGVVRLSELDVTGLAAVVLGKSY